MNTHKNARMTVHGRALLVRRIEEEGWRVADAATPPASLSAPPTSGWRAIGRAASGCSRTGARRPPDAASPACRDRRRDRAAAAPAPERAADRPPLGLPRSTVGAILRRLGLGRLSALEPKPPVVRYERAAPGELIHIDTKKLGRIDGVGHRITGDRRGQKKGIGWELVHVGVDDASRLAYTEVLPDEKKESACAFLDPGAGLLRPPWRHRRAGHDRQRLRLSAATTSAISAALPACATSAPGPTRRAPTARPSASSRPPCANGPTPAPTASSAERTHAMIPWIDAYNHPTTPLSPRQPNPMAQAEQPSWKRSNRLARLRRYRHIFVMIGVSQTRRATVFASTTSWCRGAWSRPGRKRATRSCAGTCASTARSRRNRRSW